ncbi:hypothetical protein H2203_002293 [Taxawa tesnikishii (nom. ined.)]|nr:hypothetical protein H2203_002293 [Dothideales sp. JES 119]
MEHAFSPGDPVLDLAAKSVARTPDDEESSDRSHWVLREEQHLLDKIVSGQKRGQYHLLIGEKGTGKSSMLIDAMAKINGEESPCKALDFEYHEDNIGALFSIRGPRDASALLDIERAFNKLEKVALKRRDRVGRPLILIINSMHLLRDDDDGKDLLELVQQRAEQWAASNLATVIFNSDDYWIYERLKQYATRMNVIPILDLTKPQALAALRNYRSRYFNETFVDPPPNILDQVYDKVGGRLSFLNRVAKSQDMLKTCDDICRSEKTWFLNQCWILGQEMDDDVMDQQRESDGGAALRCRKGHVLAQIPLHEARYIMTRADFIQQYDAINLFTIDSTAMVRADSVPMMNAFREICAQEGFEEHLEKTLDRISAIESLGRTRELTIKDLWNSGKYRITTRNAKGAVDKTIEFEVEPGKEEEEDDDDDDAGEKGVEEGK